MQFKYPELLWWLFLLVIPIIIHLFQLRKFKKTPFTNVKFLKEVVAESRKSNTLKKWLLLLTRLGILACLVLAFAQPFTAQKTALEAKETVIYLDNSFSMQAQEQDITLLSNAVQELLKETPKDQKITLFTNDKVFKNVAIKEIQNNLLSLAYSTTTLSLKAALLKAKTLFSTHTNSLKNTIIISDFQERMGPPSIDSLENNYNTHYIVKRPQKIENISIDSLYMDTTINEHCNIVALLSSNTPVESTPISLYNKEKLIAKTAAVFNTNKKAQVTFSLPKNKKIKGLITITDQGLKYDNRFYFNIEDKAKIKVLAIGENTSFLNRIYTEDDFIFSEFKLKNLNYSTLKKQNTIVLNELTSIPNALSIALHSFTKEGGTIIVIPSETVNINSYNALISPYFSTKIKKPILQEQLITNIAYNHPIYQNVFQNKVTNFQYPKVASSYQIQTKASNALSYANNTPFLIGNAPFYLFSASLSKENSNFKNASLIVPTFYTIAALSLKTPQLYRILGTTNTLDLTTEVLKDRILSVENEDFSFIPRQENYTNKVRLYFNENPSTDGIYKIQNNNIAVQNISFNYDRKESALNYTPITQLNAKNVETNLHDLFTELQKDNSINAFWKWFVIFTLVFMVLELLFQKFIP